MTEQRLLTVPEAANRLGVSRSKGWQLAQQGEIPVVRIGRSVRVPADALDAWIKERTQGAA
jgi:excisionase family DNA binding protein